MLTKNKIKLFLSWFFILIAVCICTYFGLAFVTWEFNPANWESFDRAFLLFWSAMCATIVTASDCV